MKEKLRGFLGFLGLVEDDYGDYGPSNAPRPFSEQPEEFEPEWAPTPTPAARTFNTQPANPLALPSSRGSTWTFEGRSHLGTRRFQRGEPGAPDREPEAPRAVLQSAGPSASATWRSSHPKPMTTRVASPTCCAPTVPSVLATLDVDAGLARRLVDFTAGTAYAMNAKIEMLIRGVYLISPQGMHVGPEMKERLRAANYHAYDQA